MNARQDRPIEREKELANEKVSLSDARISQVEPSGPKMPSPPTSQPLAATTFSFDVPKTGLEAGQQESMNTQPKAGLEASSQGSKSLEQVARPGPKHEPQPGATLRGVAITPSKYAKRARRQVRQGGKFSAKKATPTAPPGPTTVLDRVMNWVATVLKTIDQIVFPKPEAEMPVPATQPAQRKRRKRKKKPTSLGDAESYLDEQHLESTNLEGPLEPSGLGEELEPVRDPGQSLTTPGRKPKANEAEPSDDTKASKEKLRGQPR